MWRLATGLDNTEQECSQNIKEVKAFCDSKKRVYQLYKTNNTGVQVQSVISVNV